MKKIKLFFWIIGFLLTLCVGVVLVAINLVDLNDYKPRIEQLVQSNSGRQLNLIGDLGLTFYPWIGISTGALVLSNGEGFGDTPMLTVAQANIKIKLLPLLRDKFEIGTIILNKPKLRLVTREDGLTNWDDFLGSWKIADTSQQKTISKNAAKDSVMIIAGLVVQGVSLVAGEIVWDDRNNGQLITLSNLNLSIGEMQPATPLNIELSARIAGNVMPIPAEINFSSRVIVDEKLNVINIDKTSVEMTMGAQRYGKADVKTTFSYLNDRIEINSLTADMEINGQDTRIDIPFASLNLLRQKLTVPALRIQQNGLEINTNLVGGALFSGAESINLAGSLKLHIADLPDFFEHNQWRDIFPAGLIKTITSEMDYALHHGNLLLSSMKTFADETTLAGSILLNGVLTGNKLVGTVKQNIQNIHIRKILTALDITDVFAGTGMMNLHLTGIDMRAEKPLSKMSGQIEFNLQDGAIKGFDLQAALIKLDNTLNLITRKQTQYKTAVDNQTKFFELSGAFKGVNGHFQTNNIFMQSPGLQAKGRGSLDLPSQVIDLKFDVAIVESVANQGIGLSALGLENLASLTLPLTISGKLTAPRYRLDVNGLLKQQAQKKTGALEKTVTEKLLKLLGE